MSSLVFRVLLRLLPRRRRLQFGGEMHDVYRALATDTRARFGALGASVLFMKELRGLVRFSFRERFGRLLDWRPAGGNWHPLRELHWAWRGVRGRGWRAAFIVTLFGLVLAANTIVFSAADAFVFRAVPYPRGDRLAQIEQVWRGSAWSSYLPVQVIAEWRKHTDLFLDVQAHELAGPAYVTIAGITESIPSAQITPGLLELLRVMPIAGRPFVAADVAPGAPPVVIISARIARRMYGSVSAAVGEAFHGGKQQPTIVGVMPETFRFPGANEQVWRPLSLEPDPRPGLLATNRANIVRLADGIRIADVSAAVEARGPGVSQVIPTVMIKGTPMRRPLERLRVQSLLDARRHAGASIVFAMLVGAAACLLLIACSNVASLELAGATRRLRTHAVLAALGASPHSQARTVLFESAGLIAGSVAIALPLASWGTTTLATYLTTSMAEALANPIDIDGRAIEFMLVAATCAVTATLIPTWRRLARLSVSDALANDPRVLPVTRAAARTRQWLMGAQVALTALLLIGGTLYVRSYLARLAIDRGFDDAGLVTIEVRPADDATRRGAELERAVLDGLRSAPGVRSVARTGSFPPSTVGGFSGRVWFDDQRDPHELHPKLASYPVDPEFFQTAALRFLTGRAFTADDPADRAVITERFARRFWPGRDPIGGRFRIQGGLDGRSAFTVIGVVRDFRQDQLVEDTGEEVFVTYMRLSATYSPLRFIARVDDGSLPAAANAVRTVADRSVVRLGTIAERYAQLDGDKRLASSITSGFGLLALVVATAGIYGVMAFLVAGRAREIGIRMALGADRGAVQRLIFGASMRAVIAGIVAGAAAALVASRWMASQLYGVSAGDPSTYVGVGVLIAVTAAAATWLPARRAAAVDPAVTLRAE